MRSALDLVRAIREGDLTAAEVVESALARAAEVQPQLNPFAEVRADDARRAAAAVDAARAAGRPLGPLAGVPVAIKDLTPVAGWRTTCGSVALSDHVADRSAVIVRRLEAAGAVILGKTTTPEFAHSSFTESPLLGVTRNPWDPSRTPGGSSGGSAVAVATGCVALAEGSDMGGSVRIPAALSGCVGLKPSLGRIP
ncbi:MAG: amidase, partial [Rhodobacteraceae bacterium]